MALTSQITTSLLQVDGRMTEGGVIEIVPGARLLLDVGVENVEPGALLDEIATAVAEAQAARDEAVDISGISTSDAVIASRIETPGTATQTALSATFATKGELASASNVADSLAIQRLDRQALSQARSKGSEASVAYADATELIEDWADLTAPVVPATNAQVSGNRLYAVGTANPGGMILPFVVAVNENAHIESLLYWKAGGSGNPLYFGIDCGTAGHAPAASSPDGAFIGLNSSGARASFKGANLVGLTSASNIGTTPTVDTTYAVSVDIDERVISFSLREVGSTTVISTAYMPRPANINNIAVFIQDGRGTGGHGVGPIVAVKSLQQPRTKTVATQTIGGLRGRHIITGPAGLGDVWRVALPKNYDARKPAPVVLWAHQSLSGSANTLWSETRSQPLAAALSDAGFILAAPTDGGDRWGNAASLDNYRALYEYVRDRWNTGPLFMIGASMGFLPVLNSLARRALPTPAAVVSIGGVANLDLLWAQSAYDDGIATAYGISGPDAPDSEYETATSGYNPMDRNGWEFRGVPMRFYSGATDTVVTTAGHAAAMAAKVAPYAPASVVELTGSHLANGHYVADVDADAVLDIVEFFQTYA